jgi:hypothetical protein
VVPSVVGFLATLAVLAALVVLAAFATVLARSVVPPPFSGLVGAAVFGVALYVVAKAAA